MDVLEHVGIGDAPHAGECLSCAFVFLEAVLDLAQERDSGVRLVEAMDHQMVEFLRDVADPAMAWWVLRPGQDMEHSPRACCDWCTERWREAERGRSTHPWLACQCRTGLQDQALDNLKAG